MLFYQKYFVYLIIFHCYYNLAKADGVPDIVQELMTVVQNLKLLGDTDSSSKDKDDSLLPSAPDSNKVPAPSAIGQEASIPTAADPKKVPAAPASLQDVKVPSAVSDVNKLVGKKFKPFCIPRSLKKKKNETLPYCALAPEELLSGRSKHGSVVHRTPFPSWMNLEQARRGQEFAANNRYSMSNGALAGLLTNLPFPDARDVLCFTSNSDTAEKSLKRYAATTQQMFIWFDEMLNSDPKNNPVLKSVSNVRGLHAIAASKANAILKGHGEINPPDKYKNMTTDDEMWDALVADLSTPHNLKYFKDYPVNYTKTNSEAVYVNQFIQGLTLAGFIGFTVLYPENVYIYDATDDDLEAVLHLFAIVGYIVGVDDDYNVCLQPNAKAAKIYFKEIFDKYTVPGLIQVEKGGKILVESFVNGFFMNGTAPGQSPRTIMLRIVRDFLKVEVPHMTSILSPSDAKLEEEWDNTFVKSTHLPTTKLAMNEISKKAIDASVFRYFGNYLTNEDKGSHIFYRPGL